MVELMIVSTALYGLIRLGAGIFDAIERGLAAEEEATWGPITPAAREAILSRHRVALRYGCEGLAGAMGTICLVLETSEGQIRSSVVGLSEEAVALQSFEPRRWSTLEILHGCLEIGRERYLDVVPSLGPGCVPDADGVVVMALPPLSVMDANALSRLTGAIAPERVAA